MINAKMFVFVGISALPDGEKTVDLRTITNNIVFQPDLIASDMPFFGKKFDVGEGGFGNAYGKADYSGTNELNFKGKPEEFIVEKKKKSYQIRALVKADGDTYRISLSVRFGGSATLLIMSNSWSKITYQGELFVPKN